MLSSLSIQNYALITKLDIDFAPGMLAMTGETGAGKSIIIGALSLVQGQRADTRIIREGAQKSIVEAVFDLKNYQLQDFFEQNDLDYQDNCIIRREISTGSKSRAFINDTPVALNLLRELSARLLDIHSQHENLLLSTDDYQLQLVDSVAGNGAELNDYRKKFTHWNDSRAALRKLKAEAERQASDLDYLQFQLGQLDEAALKEGELEELEGEQEKLAHVEEIKQALSQADYLMSESEENSIGAVRMMIDALLKISDFLPEAGSWSDRLDVVHIELKDISHDLSLELNELEFDPERLKFIQERLDLIYSLQSKFKCDSVEALIELRESFRRSLQRIDNFEEELKAAEKEVGEATEAMNLSATQLHQTRLDVREKIETYLVAQLVELAMPDVKFVIEVETVSEYTDNGNDRVQFLFSANKNRSVQPVAEIASGGEISRVMLAIKSLLVNKSALPTIIFDEIDTGVSGEIAGRVGDIMKQMSANTQVIVITHLPQIAARGDQHYRVYKDNSLESTETFIEKLKPEDRVGELAAMLSGKTVTDSAMKHAKELLGE